MALPKGTRNNQDLVAPHRHPPPRPVFLLILDMAVALARPRGTQNNQDLVARPRGTWINQGLAVPARKLLHPSFLFWTQRRRHQRDLEQGLVAPPRGIKTIRAWAPPTSPVLLLILDMAVALAPPRGTQNNQDLVERSRGTWINQGLVVPARKLLHPSFLFQTQRRRHQRDLEQGLVAPPRGTQNNQGLGASHPSCPSFDSWHGGSGRAHQGDLNQSGPDVAPTGTWANQGLVAPRRKLPHPSQNTQNTLACWCPLQKLRVIRAWWRRLGNSSPLSSYS